MTEVTIGELSRRGALIYGDGYRTKRSEYGLPGYRILRVADILDGCIQLEGEDYVRREFASAIGSKTSRAGDVLLTTKGTVGRVAIYPSHTEKVVYSPQLCYFRVINTEVLDPRFLAYWFKSPSFVQQAAHRANNTDMAAYINLRDISSLRLDLPAITEQREIGDVLGALDNKIAANERLISRADDLAYLRFRETANNEVRLSSLARFVNGKAFTRDATGTGRVVIRIAEMNSGIGDSTVRNDIEVSDDHLARAGDLLFAWSGSLTLARWYRPEAIVNQHIFKVIPSPGIPMWLVYQAVHAKLDQFKAIAADKATTMGHIQRHHLDEPVAIPPSEALRRIDGLMAALWETALAAEVESLHLSHARDELLPLLMSGKVRVRDAERVAGALSDGQ
jgi:type I restriction enzyme S subunit